ncbi:MAG: 7,8-didemethyl-8-hydroxy-5-deazariboflavin synthase CofG [Nitrosopumilus sp.]|nr:7,8-didemethyl-8-hydroxy-5-deazariboflavin synthase CofG [Nitrosopumilus sp.]
MNKNINSNLNYQKVFQDSQQHQENEEILHGILENKFLNDLEITRFIENSSINNLLQISNYLRNNNNPTKIITYSRKIFINLINLCKDHCSYCTYKKEPTDTGSVMLNPSQVLSIAESGKKLRCTEALIVTGERPELKYQEAKKWLSELGYKTLTELIANLSESILQRTGLLPHTNAGSLTRKEMSMLKSTNVSLGMMLENSSEKLIEEGNAHEKAPSKNPKVRIKSLVSAGELKIPVTTGLLIGIGESLTDIVKSLLLINELNKKYGHIQEVIIQNFVPKIGTIMESCNPPLDSYFLKCIASARLILKDINIQVPPNLSPKTYSKYIDAGINDWGGISPLTPDYVNPEYPWPTIRHVKQITNLKGFTLRARLPIYPEFINNHHNMIILYPIILKNLLNL